MISLEQISRKAPVLCKDLDLCHLEGLGLSSFSPLGSLWKRDLSPDGTESPAESDDSVWTEKCYSHLQATLKQAGLPVTVDRTKEPRTGYSLSDITICILGAPSTFLPVLLEGGNLCPGDMLLCLSPAWLSKVPSASHHSECTLLVHKAVTFDLGGRSYLDEFEVPRRVTYFTGSFGMPQWESLPGLVALGCDLECPSGGSDLLAHILEDTLRMRLVLDRSGVLVPPTLAFTYRRTHMASGHVRTVMISKKDGEENLLQEATQNFLQSQGMDTIRQVAVQASGFRWSGRPTVSFHQSDDLSSILMAVITLLHKLEEGESVLLESVCLPLPVVRTPALETPAAFRRSSFPRPDLAVRICTVVCRSRGDRPQLSKVICAVGRVDKPLNHKTSIPQTLETTLQQWGVRDEAQRKAIDLQIMEMAQTAMEAVIEMEAGLLPEQRGGRRAQTDIIGVDFMLTSVDQVITPVALGVNCHLCLETCGLFESMNRPHVSAASSGSESTSSLLIQTMVKRSQYYIMEGKEVLVIGAGGISKKFIWESTRDHGIKVHLIESDPNHFASCIVHNFIHYDVTDHKRDEEHAQWIVEMVRGHSIQLDGCLSFWDDCMVLTALVCEQLCLRCSPVSAMRISKQKSRTHLHLLHHKEDSACLTTAAPFAVPCCHLESHSDVEKASHYISFPGVMKLEFGAGAVGVKLVENLEQCHQHYEKISSDLKEDTDYPGIGLGWGNAMLLMEYVSGTEHDVDIIIYDGRLMAAFVSDNGPTRVPYFTETAACMPTYLPPDKEAQLVTAAYQCCLGCGLANGVFNVELKMTPTGPKLIEINPRMGGFYLRDWIQEIYGEDIMLASVMVACSVPPLMPVHHARPRTYLVGVMCVVSLHLWALKTTASMETLKSLHKKGVIRLNMLDDDMISSEYEEPFCNVACASETREKARLQLISTCRVLGIDTMEYPVSYFTSDFK
ncbi:carnosine synthase 1 isoform X2 [Ambystoma mexicanum]|uniref:carnosine synthase 1 isoform X2 n=1 Tax=Ambystoma mexicanum TaxID=8296 RepID=UPI0037E7095F